MKTVEKNKSVDRDQFTEGVVSQGKELGFCSESNGKSL